VIDAVWPFIRGGFVSGEQFVLANRDWWHIYRRDYVEATRLRKEQVANLTHFSPTNPKERLPPDLLQQSIMRVHLAEPELISRSDIV